MAKNKHTDPVSERNGRLIRTEAYAEKVRQLFAATVNEILTLNKTMPDIANGVMYSFDGDTKKVKQKVELLLRRLHSVATMAIQKGIELEWDAAEKACDAMVKSCFGKELMSNPKFKAWTAHNGSARDAFARRSEKGMNLSQRVWRDVRALRDEMEVAITVAMGEGEDAGTISRKVRQYLNDPELMFRRFQYHEKEAVLDADGNPILDKHGKPKMQDKIGKDGKPIVRKKWKKRIADPEHPGKYKWIDYDRASYTPQGAGANSRGVYKSAAKNAMRVARTETNMAYRAADHERWRAMDFVLGIRIETSNSHEKKMPKGDICDRLAGDYPKDFDFTGWHPQCFCHATPILPSDDEMLAMAEAHDQGKPYKPKGVIRDYPDGFKEWVRENEEKLTDPDLSNPYFVSNNEGDIMKILHGEEIAEPELTLQEIAEIRHNNRTPEQVADIQKRWDERNARIEAEKQAAAKLQRENEAKSKYGSSILRIMDGIEGVDTSALKSAIDSGNFDAIMQEAAALRAIGKQIKKTAGNVLKVASEYGEVDASELQAIMDAGKIGEMRAATKALGQQILKQKQFEASISDIIPDAHDWHKHFTASELQVVHDVVESKLAGWSHLSLEEQKKKLEFEAIDFLGGNMHGVQSKYKTWKVSQAAYLKKLDAVQLEIYWQDAQKPIDDALNFISKSKTTSKPFAQMVADVQAALAAKDKAAYQSALAVMQKKQHTLEANFASRSAKKSGTTAPIFDADAYTKKRKDAAMWAKNPMDADARLRAKCGDVWRNASADEKDGIHGYTEEYHNINEPLRGLTYIGSPTKTARGLRRIPHIESIIRKSTYDFDMWVQRGDSMVALKKFGLTNYNYATDAEIYALVGREGVEGAFWSAGVAKGKGFSGQVIFNIYIPKGAQAMYCEPFSAFGHGSGKHWDGISPQSSIGYEAEILIQRGTKYRVTKVEKSASGTWYVDLEIIEQNPVPFPYVGGYPFL